MTYPENNLVLSDMVKSTPRSSFFDALIEIPTKRALLSHDFFKINKIVDDIFGYLTDLLTIFREIRNSELKVNDDLRWFYEGRDGIYELCRNMDNIDSTISQLLGTLDEHGHDDNSFTTLLGKFEETSDLLLEVKKFLIVFKKKVDISVNYMEINENIISTLTMEIEDCIDVLLKLLKLKLSSPKKHLSKFNLEAVTSKMKINYLTSKSFSTRSMRLPTFNDLDEYIYNEYLSLESRISPLRVSLEYLPLKIEEFTMHCKSTSITNLFPSSISNIETNYTSLMKRWDYLQNEIKLIKKESLDSKWNDVFTYLIHEIISKCDFLIDSLLDKQVERKLITDEIGSIYKLCSNSITLITKAFAESTIYESSLASLFNNELLPKWQTLNDILSGPLNPSNIGVSQASYGVANDSTLKTYHTFRKSPTPELSDKELFPKKSDHGLGIDLGVDVASSSVPFSIKKKDKIKSLSHSEITSGKKDLKKALANVHNDTNADLDYIPKVDSDIAKEDDEITLVNSKTPKLPFEVDNINQKMSKLKFRDPFESEDVWNKVINSVLDTPSRIPFIVEDYIKLGFPVIKKNTNTTNPISRIPTISPNHPVFNDSPDRGHESISLKPPLFLINRSNTIIQPSPTPTRSRIVSNDDDVFRKPSRRPSIITHMGRPPSSLLLRSVSLNETATPNLLFQQPTYRSTSPDRPPSSIGSRFDDKHLIQPLKNVKPGWK